jgi:YjbE family integral membrane protein
LEHVEGLTVRIPSGKVIDYSESVSFINRPEERFLMDLGYFGSISLDWTFISGLLSVIIVNVILSGDNAVVIAMAVRSLPRAQRQKGILVGAGGAVLLRIVLTFFVASLLQIPYLKIAGGALILWLAVRLFLDAAPEDDESREAGTLWQALKIIVIADITMSLDNMLGVGAASKGNLFLLIFGLGTSIPIMVVASSMLSMLMDKYPIIIYIGAAVLGKVGGEMIITDPIVIEKLVPSDILIYFVEALAAAGVIVVGRLWARWTYAKQSEIGPDTHTAKSNLQESNQGE